MSQFQSPPNQPQYTSPGQYQPPPSPPKKRSRHRFFAIGCGALIALVVLIVIIAADVNAGNNSTSTNNTAASATQPAQATQAVQPTQAPATPTVEPTQAPTPIPTHAPQPRPTQPPAPKPTPTPTPSCQAVNNNPWCYNFVPGKLIYVPPNGFCNYFNCIATFYAPDDPGDGYIIECSDSTFSQSGGESGACSSHGGVLKPLYSH